MKCAGIVLPLIMAGGLFAQEQIAFRPAAVRQDTVDEPPTVVKQVSPVYPQSAQEERAEGVVWLRVFVNEHGKPAAAEVLKSPRDDFAEAAKQAVMQFEFTPGKLKDKPVGVWVSIPFKFKLQESEAKLEFPQGGLTPDQIARALSSLGIHVQPVRYTLPYEHRISVTVDVYRNGKKDTTYVGTLLQRAKEVSMVVTCRNDGGKLTVAISNENASRTYAVGDLGSNNAVLYQELEDVHLMMNKRSAFYVVAAAVDAVGTIRGGNAEAYIKKYPLVVVLSAELKPKEAKEK